MKKSILLLTAAAAGLSLAQTPLQAQAAPCFSVIQIRPESLYQSDCNPSCDSDCTGAGGNTCTSAPQVNINDINDLLEQLGLPGQCSPNTDCGDTLNNLNSCQPQIRFWTNCTPQISICTPMTPAVQEQEPDVVGVPSQEDFFQEDFFQEDSSVEKPSAENVSAETPTHEEPANEVPAIPAPSNEAPTVDVPAEPEPSAEATTPVVVTPVQERPTPAAPSQETQTPVEKPSEPDTQTDTQAVTEPETTSYHAYVLRIVELVNEARADAGLKPVTLRQDLTAVAQLRAKETVTLFSHTRPNGTSCFTALGEYGVSYRGAGENIAYGQRSPEEVMEGWMNSSGHRANILNANFTSIGVGYYQAANGVKYWSQMFTY